MDMEIASLEIIDGFSFPVFSSTGGSVRARSVAARSERAISWLASHLEMPPTPPLFVLGRQDWHRIALMPQYGLPHVSRKRILMGQDASEIWHNPSPGSRPDCPARSGTRRSNVSRRSPSRSSHVTADFRCNAPSRCWSVHSRLRRLITKSMEC
jgi:hypothetical protein